MSHVFLFHGDADADRARDVASRMKDVLASAQPLSRLSKTMSFGPQVRVVVAWSHAASAQAESSWLAHAPMGAPVLLLDDAPAPAALSGQGPCIVSSNDPDKDAAALRAALRVSVAAAAMPPLAPRPVHRRPAAASAPRPAVAARPVPSVRASASLAVSRAPRRPPVGLVASGSAFGAMAAMAIGWAAPAHVLASAASSAPLQPEPEAVEQVQASGPERHAALPPVSNAAQFATPVALTVVDIAAIEAELARAEAQIENARSWSNTHVAQLDRINASSGLEAAVVEIMAQASAPAVPAVAEQPRLELRERFASVAPFEHAVDVVPGVLAGGGSEAVGGGFGPTDI